MLNIIHFLKLKVRPNFYALYALYQREHQRKSIGTKAAHKMIVILTHAGQFGATLSTAESKLIYVIYWLEEVAVFESKEIMKIPLLPVL